MEEKEAEHKWMELLHREYILQMPSWIFITFVPCWHPHTPLPKGKTEISQEFLLFHCFQTVYTSPSVSFWKSWMHCTLMPLSHCSLPTHIVSKTCLASSLLIRVLTKQQKEVVYYCVYFPSLRCGFLTTKLGLFWESSTSKTWSNLLHPEAIVQNRVMAAAT